MTDNDLNALAIVAILVAVVVASSVGASRADAAKECYKAAQVNHAITCGRDVS